MKMLNKVLALIVALCLLHVATAYRLPRAAEKKSSEESSEEFTEADLKLFQAELEKSLSKEQADRITSVFSKFTTGKTSEENAEGFIGLLLLMFSSELGSTDGKDGVEETANAKSVKLNFFELLRDALNSTTTDDNSSEEFTEKDLQELQVSLEKQLPREKVDQIVNVFSKFTKGADPEKQLEGFLELIGLLIIDNSTELSSSTVKPTPAIVELTENTV